MKKLSRERMPKEFGMHDTVIRNYFAPIFETFQLKIDFQEEAIKLYKLGYGCVIKWVTPFTENRLIEIYKGLTGSDLIFDEQLNAETKTTTMDWKLVANGWKGEANDLRAEKKELHETLRELSLMQNDWDKEKDKMLRKVAKWKGRAKLIKIALGGSEIQTKDIEALEKKNAQLDQELKIMKKALLSGMEKTQQELLAITGEEKTSEELKVGDKVECLVEYVNIRLKTKGEHFEVHQIDGCNNCHLYLLGQKRVSIPAKLTDLKKL